MAKERMDGFATNFTELTIQHTEYYVYHYIVSQLLNSITTELELCSSAFFSHRQIVIK
jgi:hypothetical protein